LQDYATQTTMRGGMASDVTASLLLFWRKPLQSDFERR
jgi:hypothetical protein